MADAQIVQLPYQDRFEPRDKYRERCARWRRARGWMTQPQASPAERGEIARWQQRYDYSPADLPLFQSFTGQVVTWPGSTAASGSGGRDVSRRTRSAR